MSGSVSGFEGFVTSRGAAMLRLAYILSGDRSLAEDLVQEAFAKAHRHWARVGAAGQPEAYVRRMVVNEYLGWRRRRRNQEVPVEIPDRPHPVDDAQVQAEQDAMWRALAVLPRQQRAVLVLRYYQDLSDDEIAILLGCAVGTVRSSASRAFAVLRRHPGLASISDGDDPVEVQSREDR